MEMVVRDEASLKQFVREIRRARGMPQEALAMASGYGRKTVSEFENAGSSMLSTALDLLASLGCEVVIRVPRSPGPVSNPSSYEEDDIVFDGPVP